MAKSTTSNISIRMDSDLKAAAEALYEELGMNLSTAFNIFVRQSLRVKKPSLLCLRQKGLQKILTSKDTMMLMNFLQILIHDKI